MGDYEEKSDINKVLLMLKGLMFSIIMSLIMILILSLVLSLTDLKENIIMPTVIFISSFCILIGSFLVAKRVNQNGIVYGSLLGLIYMMVLYFISSIMSFNFSLNINSIVMIVFGIVGGAVGGILGVNLK